LIISDYALLPQDTFTYTELGSSELL